MASASVPEQPAAGAAAGTVDAPAFSPLEAITRFSIAYTPGSLAPSPLPSTSLSQALAAAVAGVADRPDPFGTPLTPANIDLDSLDLTGGHVDSAARSLLYAQASLPDDNRQDNAVSNTLDAVLLLSEAGRCEYTLVHLLILDVLDVHPVEWCLRFWTFLETREERLTKNISGRKPPGTTIIRFCNAILRRLSATQGSTFAGKVLMFLARAFPLSELSGLNQRGEFNVANTTTWDPPQSLPAGAADAEAYATFWGLQQAFANPPAALADPAVLARTRAALTEVLEGLRAQATVGSSDRARTDPDVPDTFVPKWLTSYSLFDLELRDVSFRRAIYAQIRIFVEYALHTAAAGPPPANKALAAPAALTSDDVAFFRDLVDALQRVPGRAVDLDAAYVRSLNIVLRRDKAWVRWKEANTPSFELPPHVPEPTPAGPGLKRPYRHAMGTPALSRLFASTPTGIGRLRRGNEYGEIPPPDKYRRPADPDEEESADKRSSREWRGLRAARSQGMWIDFSRVTRDKGFGGLFEGRA
ncbi:THO complex subunit 1 transcription elongation factor-domain-containing protein [Dipodascopsis tothii]|uniref:THO complex subunit 1 transcription elongation factor-domain-containing protein n=1 Tax=Dipodascopsis tothii TaxID=44089 RepID=UPI0034D00CE3